MYHVQARLLEQMVTVAYEGLLTNLKDIVGSQGKNIPNVMSERDVIVSLEKIFRGIIDEEVRGYKGGIFNNPIQKAESALKEWDSVNGPSGNDDSGGGTPLGGAGTDGGAKPDSGQAVKKIAIDETSAQLAVAKKTQEENPAFNRGMIAIGEVAQALQKENDEMREPFTRGMIAIAQVAQLQQTQQEQNTFFNRGIAAISEVAQLQNKQEGAAFNRGMAVIATVARKQQKLNVKEAAAFNRGMAAIGEVAKRQEDATTYQALIARGMTVLAEIIKAQQLQDAQEAAAFNRGMDIISQAASLQSDVEIKAVINRGFAAISEVARFQQDKEAALERVRLTISQELESVIEKNAQFILSDQSGAIFRKFITVIMQTAIKKESEENAKEFFNLNINQMTDEIVGDYMFWFRGDKNGKAAGIVINQVTAKLKEDEQNYLSWGRVKERLDNQFFVSLTGLITPKAFDTLSQALHRNYIQSLFTLLRDSASTKHQERVSVNQSIWNALLGQQLSDIEQLLQTFPSVMLDDDTLALKIQFLDQLVNESFTAKFDRTNTNFILRFSNDRALSVPISSAGNIQWVPYNDYIDDERPDGRMFIGVIKNRTWRFWEKQKYTIHLSIDAKDDIAQLPIPDTLQQKSIRNQSSPRNISLPKFNPIFTRLAVGIITLTVLFYNLLPINNIQVAIQNPTLPIATQEERVVIQTPPPLVDSNEIYTLPTISTSESLIVPITQSEIQAQQQVALDDVIAKAPGEWGVYIHEIGAEKSEGLRYSADVSFHAASTIKVPIALAFLRWANSQDESFAITLEQIPRIDLKNKANPNYNTRTFRKLLDSMLIDSEEEATALFVDF